MRGNKFTDAWMAGKKNALMFLSWILHTDTTLTILFLRGETREGINNKKAITGVQAWNNEGLA